MDFLAKMIGFECLWRSRTARNRRNRISSKPQYEDRNAWISGGKIELGVFGGHAQRAIAEIGFTVSLSMESKMYGFPDENNRI